MVNAALIFCGEVVIFKSCQNPTPLHLFLFIPEGWKGCPHGIQRVATYLSTAKASWARVDQLLVLGMFIQPLMTGILISWVYNKPLRDWVDFPIPYGNVMGFFLDPIAQVSSKKVSNRFPPSLHERHISCHLSSKDLPGGQGWFVLPVSVGFGICLDGWFRWGSQPPCRLRPPYVPRHCCMSWPHGQVFRNSFSWDFFL